MKRLAALILVATVLSGPASAEQPPQNWTETYEQTGLGKITATRDGAKITLAIDFLTNPQELNLVNPPGPKAGTLVQTDNKYIVEVFEGKTDAAGNPFKEANAPSPSARFFGMFIMIIMSNDPGSPLQNTQEFKYTFTPPVGQPTTQDWTIDVPSGKTLRESNIEINVPGLGGTRDAVALLDFPGSIFPAPVGTLGPGVMDGDLETLLYQHDPKAKDPNDQYAVVYVNWGFIREIVVDDAGTATMKKLDFKTPSIVPRSEDQPQKKAFSDENDAFRKVAREYAEKQKQPKK